MSDAIARLLKERIVYLGDINEAVADAVVAQLQALECNPSQPASLYLNSKGGPLSAALRIYEAMQKSAFEVATVVVGRADYAAAMLAAAGTPGRRASATQGRFLLGPPVIDGSGLDFQGYLKAVQHHCDTINPLLARHTGQSIQRLAGFSEPTELSAEEALQWGLIDRVLG